MDPGVHWFAFFVNPEFLAFGEVHKGEIKLQDGKIKKASITLLINSVLGSGEIASW